MILFILGGVFMLGLCIVVHEFGHYILGRAVGIQAETFSIGYGRGIWKKKIGVTTWQITAIPLGGYVKFYGDDYSNPSQEPGSFLGAHPLRRIIPVIGGPLFNLILGVIVFVILHSFSGPVAPRIAVMEELGVDSPAYRAGLRNGDLVLAINGEGIRDFYDLRKQVALSEGKALAFRVDRGGERIDFQVKPDVIPSGTAFIGVRPPGQRYVEVDFLTKDVWGYRFRSLFSKDTLPRSMRAMPYLHEGDVLLTAQGREIHSVRDLQKVLGDFHGQTVELKLRRQTAAWLAPWFVRDETIQIPSMGEYKLVLSGLRDEKYGTLIPDQVLESQRENHQRLLTTVTVNSHPAGSFENLLKQYAEPHKATVQFEERTYTGTVKVEKIGLLGFIQAERIETEYMPAHSGFADIAGAALKDTKDNVMLYPSFFGGLFAGRYSFVDNATGPVGMFRYAGTIVKSGFHEYLQLLAAISIALMVMNLIPFPVVDGGHIVFFLYEAVAGRPVPLRAMDAIYRLGFSVLLLFGLWITYRDVISWVGF